MNEDIKKVIEQIIAMFNNNVLNDNGLETFEGWCEDGEVFENEKQINIMKIIATDVDNITEKIFAINEQNNQ